MTIETTDKPALSDEDLQLCARVVDRLFYGIPAMEDPLDIPNWFGKELKVDESKLLALAERLFQWSEKRGG